MRILTSLAFLCLLFLHCVPANAVQISTDENVLSGTLSEQTIGILYRCQPYCEFLAINEGSGWKPAFSDLWRRDVNLKLIKPQDPEYPLLLISSATPERAASTDKQEIPLDPYLTKYEAQKIRDGDFFLWEYGFSLTAAQSRLTSNNNILAEAAIPRSVEYGLFTQLRPLLIWHVGALKIRPLLSFDFQAVPMTKDIGGESSISESTKGIDAEFRSLWNFGGIFARFRYEQSSQVGSSRIESYTLHATHLTSQLGFSSGTWSFWTKLPLSSTSHDELGYRAPPLSRTLQAFFARKCFGKIRKFGLEFSPCVEGGWTAEEQISDVNPALVTGQSEIRLRWERWLLGGSLRFGDLMWQ